MCRVSFPVFLMNNHLKTTFSVKLYWLIELCVPGHLNNVHAFSSPVSTEQPAISRPSFQYTLLTQKSSVLVDLNSTCVESLSTVWLPCGHSKGLHTHIWNISLTKYGYHIANVMSHSQHAKYIYRLNIFAHMCHNTTNCNTYFICNCQICPKNIYAHQTWHICHICEIPDWFI